MPRQSLQPRNRRKSESHDRGPIWSRHEWIQLCLGIVLAVLVVKEGLALNLFQDTAESAKVPNADNANEDMEFCPSGTAEKGCKCPTEGETADCVWAPFDVQVQGNLPLWTGARYKVAIINEAPSNVSTIAAYLQAHAGLRARLIGPAKYRQDLVGSAQWTGDRDVLAVDAKVIRALAHLPQGQVQFVKFGDTGKDVGPGIQDAIRHELAPFTKSKLYAPRTYLLVEPDDH
jgi:hypothetical protein